MIGFIGLGIMGKPMALNLLKAGVPVMANDLSTEAQEVIGKSGGEIGSYTEIGEKCQTNLKEESYFFYVFLYYRSRSDCKIKLEGILK